MPTDSDVSCMQFIARLIEYRAKVNRQLNVRISRQKLLQVHSNQVPTECSNRLMRRHAGTLGASILHVQRDPSTLHFDPVS